MKNFIVVIVNMFIPKEYVDYVLEKWKSCKIVDCKCNISDDYRSLVKCMMCKQHSTTPKYYKNSK